MSTASVEDRVEHVDVLIIGAGISGIAAAYSLSTQHPAKTFAILEARGATGGTWDLFRYPGIRSDSDLHTFSYEFKPWRNDKAIAGAEAILDYLRETATENGIDSEIRLHHKVHSAAWSSSDGRWLVEIERTDTGEQQTLSCRWLFCAGGYYRYDQGFTPDFEGRERFQGRIVHPQHWPEDLDYRGQRVVVIGSGATAVTLIPALAGIAAHVTMLQRSPSYVLAVPSSDKIANRLPTLLGVKRAYAITRRKNIARQWAIFRFCRAYPRLARRVIRYLTAKQLPKGYPVDEHFNPAYNPWDQRLCVVPDGDLFKAVRDGDASVVTDRIDTFTEQGIKLASGRELEADIIVTATGLNLQAFGGIALTVDGATVNPPDKVAFRGFMLDGVPNFSFAFGSTNLSWTLKVGLVGEHFCRLLAYMDTHGHTVCYPEFTDPHMVTRPLVESSAGYVKRSIEQFPRQGANGPWQISPDHWANIKTLRHGPVPDENLRFGSAPSPSPAIISAVEINP
ncbi:flavin-containing monooxygenase [Nocardia sp. NBC_00403]|uniref:flavin-containing monooxygenase n=1 Tax=Nocardia sp. NBC_00403 TaxID=2975990 RepID=UPI002E1FBE37